MIRRAPVILLLSVAFAFTGIADRALLPSLRERSVDAASLGGAFVPVTPCRLLDTRQGGGARLAAGSTTRLQVSGGCGVMPASRAATITVTASDASEAGFLTLFAAGSPRPTASNINFRTDSTIANSAVVSVDASGAIEIYTSAPTHVIIDVGGAFVDTVGPTSAGRFTPVQPTRLVDTRGAGGAAAGDVAVPLPPGVPADASALAVSVTLTDASGPTYVTVHPAGTARPNSSIVNTDQIERARTVTTFAAVTSAGLIVHRSARSNVIIDLVGWFTGPSSLPSTDGLFVATPPTRVWDSRTTFDPLHRDGTAERQLAPPTVGPVAGVVVNVTAIDATRPGYVTAYPAGTAQPYVSMLNVTWRDPLASLTVVSTTVRGGSFFASAGMHLVVDVAGYFTGPMTVATDLPRANTPPASGDSVLFVSDSSLSGIRWNGQVGSLQGANIVYDLESCRRLIGASCRGREGYAPTTAVAAVATSPGRFDTLVIAVGYNDFSSTFAAGFDAVIAAARARGIGRVVWLTYREPVTYQSPAHASNAANYVAYNVMLRSFVAQGRYPEVTLADWNGYTATRPAWFSDDGLHLNDPGAWAAGEYVSRTLAFLDRRPCPSALGGSMTAGGWCASPDVTGPTS